MSTAEISDCPFRLGVVLLAAGASSRMGRPKLLLPWGNTSILGHLLRQWGELGVGQTTVVHASKDVVLAKELDRLSFPPNNRIPNPTPEKGMFSSIQCAARWDGWHPDLTHWAIVLGDQPQLQPATLRNLLAFAAAQVEKICQPSHKDHPRHPVILPRRFFVQLAHASEQNLKEFLQARRGNTALCPIEDSGLEMDIDSPADYERAIKSLEIGTKNRW